MNVSRVDEVLSEQGVFDKGPGTAKTPMPQTVGAAKPSQVKTLGWQSLPLFWMQMLIVCVNTSVYK